jgi:AcrR family transcriptional regulator
MPTRESILDAAAAEILQHGYAASSLSAIASRLGLTKGALVRRFPSKEALAQALVEILRADVIGQHERSTQAYPDSGIRAMIDFLWELGTASEAKPLVAAAAVLITDRTSPTFAMAEVLDAWRSALVAFFEQAKRVGELPESNSARELAEYTVISSVGEAALSAHIYAPAARDEPLHFLRFTLRAAGVVDVDAMVDEVLARRPAQVVG